MSISLFNELRPLYRLLEDPFTNPSDNRVARRRGGHPNQDQEQDQGILQLLRQPAIDVSEEDHRYIIEAELPGVKKENVNIFVGDNGKSITIEGREYARSVEETGEQQGGAAQAERAGGGTAKDEGALSRSSSSGPRLVSAERTNRTSFTRTIWLPRPVDGNKVSAKLQDGILTLDVPKMEDKEVVRVSIQ